MENLLSIDGATRIGVGATGICHRVETSLGPRLVKVLHARDKTERIRQRLHLLRVANVAHPNLARILSLEEADQQVHLVREWVDGESLASWLDANGPIPMSAAAHILVPVMEAVQALHERHLVHGEIKPGHVLFGPGGLKLIDAGLPSGDRDFHAPEVSADHSPTLGADLFQLATLVVTIVSGAPPLRGGELTSDVPTSLARLVERCLERNPMKRPFSVRPLLDELHALVERSSRPPPIPTHRASMPAPAPADDDIPEVTSGIIQLADDDALPLKPPAPLFGAAPWPQTFDLPDADLRIPVGFRAVVGGWKHSAETVIHSAETVIRSVLRALSRHPPQPRA